MFETGVLIVAVAALVWIIVAVGSIERQVGRQTELLEKAVEHLEELTSGARDRAVEKSLEAVHRTLEAAFPHASRETRRFLREHGHVGDV